MQESHDYFAKQCKIVMYEKGSEKGDLAGFAEKNEILTANHFLKLLDL